MRVKFEIYFDLENLKKPKELKEKWGHNDKIFPRFSKKNFHFTFSVTIFLISVEVILEMSYFLAENSNSHRNQFCRHEFQKSQG